MTTIHARKIQLTKMHIRETTPSEESTSWEVDEGIVSLSNYLVYSKINVRVFYTRNTETQGKESYGLSNFERH